MEGLQWVAEIAFRHLWQSALILALVTGLLLRKEKWSAEHRSWIWAICVMLMGMMPFVTLIPTPQLELSPEQIPAVSRMVDEPGALPLTSYSYNASLIEPIQETIDSTFFDHRILFWIILAVWGVVTIRASMQIFFAWQRTHELRLNAEPVSKDAPFLPESWPGKVLVAVSNEINGPMAIGVLEPCVLLPKSLTETLSPEQLKHVLAHELAHIKRGDLIGALAQRILLAFYWWSPFMRLGCYHLRTEREMACDDRAARMAGSSKNYATSLLDSAEALIVDRRTTTNLMAVGAFENGNGNFFTRRIKRLINANYRDDLKLGQPQMMGLTGATAVIALLFVLSPRTAFSAVEIEDKGFCCANLIEAIYTQDHELKKELIAKGGDVNCTSDDEGTPLIVAARKGDAALVAWLIAEGADVNLQIGGEGSPLYAAAKRGHLSIVKKLLAAGADPNSVIDGDDTALMVAARKGNFSVVKYLVKYDADIDFVLWDGDEKVTAISEAKRKGHSGIAYFLKERQKGNRG